MPLTSDTAINVIVSLENVLHAGRTFILSAFVESGTYLLGPNSSAGHSRIGLMDSGCAAASAQPS